MSSSSPPDVILETVNKKGVIILNRPKALNALDLSMIRKIYPTLKAWEKSMSMVIIKGTGEKAFCSGGDIKAVTLAGKKGDPLYKDFFREEYMLNYLIGTYHIPYVALIDGITMGGGVGLSVHGYYRVATERTVFAMPETAIGLFPDVGGTYILPRLGGKLGLFLALTGHRLRSYDVMKAGIATHFCDAAKLTELETQLLNLTNPEREIEGVLQKFTKESVLSTKEFSLKPFLDKIDKCFSGDSVEQIFANLEKDGSEWSQKTLDTLKKMSPTSLKITKKAIDEGESKSLQECLVMEYRLAQKCSEDHDFYEGKRFFRIE